MADSATELSELVERLIDDHDSIYDALQRERESIAKSFELRASILQASGVDEATVKEARRLTEAIRRYDYRGES